MSAFDEMGLQGLGCMGMSDFYGPTDGTEARATLDRALELGVRLYDTADMYGMGRNEEFIAPFVQANRERVFLATKFAIERKADDPTHRVVRNDPPYIRQAVDASLRRLGVDHIDLYYMHRRNPEVPFAESVGAMAELVQAGKVRFLGLSEVTGEELREAHAVHPITALQSEWSLFSRDLERSAVPAAKELGVALVPYSPLGRGFLAGQFTDGAKELESNDFRAAHPRFSGENAARNGELVAVIRKVADALGVTPAQVALAWVQQRAQVHGLPVVPIPGTRRRSRLEENYAATELTLDAEQLALLDPIASQVAGARYADMRGTANERE